jgi:hypothetical protein
LNNFYLVRRRLAVNGNHDTKYVTRNRQSKDGDVTTARDLKLIVDNTRLRLAVDNSHVQSGHCVDRFSEFAEAKRKLDIVRYTARDKEEILSARRVAFAALKSWDPEAAAPYGDGELWGFS